MRMTFSAEEIELLAKTADALSAYMGKPVLAEIDTSEDGYEWIAFATPLALDQEPDEEAVIMQMGGPSARLVGASALMEDFKQSVYSAEFLWGIQIGEPPLRFTRLDYQGEEVDYSEDLAMLLPFGLSDTDLIAEMEQNFNEEEDDDEEEEEETPEEAPYLGKTLLH